MANRGVVEFYYTRELPSRSVAIASIATDPLTPAQLTDVNNTPYLQGSLKVWKGSSDFTNANAYDFIAPDYDEAIAISGTTTYKVENQCFEITSQVSGSTPLFYYHPLPANVSDVRILDLDGSVVDDAVFLISGSQLFHDQSRKQAFRVRYVDDSGFMQVELLQYNLVITEGAYSASSASYSLAGGVMTVASTGTYYIRFIDANGYLVLPPYDGAPNAPWFARVRFPVKPPAPEWARQVFLPQRPYMLGVWVKGAVLDSHLIEFERKQMFADPDHLPDILVFDKDYAIKYAIEGTQPGSARRRGSLYPWKRGLYAKNGVDYYNSRVQVLVDLDKTDIVFGFYSYREQDVIFRALDVNPFTNPNVKNRVVKFYQKSNGLDPFRYIYYQLLDTDGTNLVENVYYEDWSAMSKRNYNSLLGSPTVTFPSDGEQGQPVLKVAGAEWRISTVQNFRYDPNKLYRMQIRVRLQTAPTDPTKDNLFVGVSAIASDGVTYLDTSGGNSSTGLQHFVVKSNEDMGGHGVGVWSTFTGYFSGTSTTISPLPAPNVQTPAPLYTGATYFKPHFIFNYSGGNGAMEVEWVRIDAISTFTNDPAPGYGTDHAFATMVVGTSVGPNQFTIGDIRSLGGGLAPAYQDIPESVDFWDLGYWDGKPYPIGGALAVYLPASILDRMTRADVEEKVKANLPMGVIPVIFYYDETGLETR